MTDIADLTKRISEALERTGASLETLGGSTPDLAALEEALAAEKTANAQLEERVKSIRDKQEGILADLETQASEMAATLEARDRDLQRVRRVNAELRDTIAQLREAHAAALPDPHLLNKAMQSELEALRAASAVDSAELSEVMAALDAIVKEAENA
ncbi:MAG: hypothetical protein AAFN59_08410 [Pseudomonadota bacterium]